MLDEETMEKLADVVANLVEEFNIEVLKTMGKTTKKIGKLSVSDAYKLVNELRYGEDYNKIINKMNKLTGISKKKIQKIFEEVAKKNQAFSKQFYDYRGVNFVPYTKNEELKRQVLAIANLTSGSFTNLVNHSGMMFNNEFVPLTKVYNKLLDEALINISMGESTYQEEMRKILREMASKGVRVVDYESGRTRNLYSVTRMHLMDGMRQLSNEVQREFAKEFGADGVEVTVHLNPAPDHADIQGLQFSYAEYEKLQAGSFALPYNGNHRVQITHSGTGTYRPISEYNCYHTEFHIILGVNNPQYNKEQLDKIKKDNEKGFKFDGKHYSNYEGTQFARKIELEIRKAKDQQIIAVASDDLEQVDLVQSRIRKLTNKYKKLCDISGLKPKAERLRVSGFRYKSTKRLK